jgi:hypothetical protein
MQQTKQQWRNNGIQRCNTNNSGATIEYNDATNKTTVAQQWNTTMQQTKQQWRNNGIQRCNKQNNSGATIEYNDATQTTVAQQ